MTNLRIPPDMGGDTQETDVRNLSESKRSEVLTEDEMSTLSRVTRGLRGGRIPAKRTRRVVLEPPNEVPVEGDTEIEACGMDGKTVKENTCVTPLYVREQAISIGLYIAVDASE
jgi:hypothetical protein